MPPQRGAGRFRERTAIGALVPRLSARALDFRGAVGWISEKNSGKCDAFPDAKQGRRGPVGRPGSAGGARARHRNLKYDLAGSAESALSSWLKSQLAEGARGPVVVAGSVLANEEMSILRAFRAGRSPVPAGAADSRAPDCRSNSTTRRTWSAKRVVICCGGETSRSTAQPTQSWRNPIAFCCSIVSANSPGCIPSRTSFLSEVRWFPPVATIFWSRQPLGRFPCTALRWRIFSRDGGGNFWMPERPSR